MQKFNYTQKYRYMERRDIGESPLREFLRADGLTKKVIHYVIEGEEIPPDYAELHREAMSRWLNVNVTMELALDNMAILTVPALNRVVDWLVAVYLTEFQVA